MTEENKPAVAPEKKKRSIGEMLTTWVPILVSIASVVTLITVILFFRPTVEAANAKLAEVNQDIGKLSGKAEAIDERIREVDQKREALTLALAQVEAQKAALDARIAAVESQATSLEQDPQKVMELLTALKRDSDAGGVLKRIDELEGLKKQTIGWLYVLSDISDIAFNGTLNGQRPSDLQRSELRRKALGTEARH